LFQQHELHLVVLQRVIALSLPRGVGGHSAAGPGLVAGKHVSMTVEASAGLVHW
jgi:hypothetical protein